MNRSHDWYHTPDGSARGYIQPHALKELWFHTGTRCNLECHFCLEGSNPADKRLASPKLADVTPHIDRAMTLGVEQFSFTGGEPFLAKDIIDILDYASQRRPCLVLTNGTEPLLKRFDALKKLQANRHPIALRLSIDHIDPRTHDAGRGDGNFAKVLVGLKKLHDNGFHVSVARHMEKDEDRAAMDKAFADLFELNGLPRDLHIVAFPDFLAPGSLPHVPQVSQHCMTAYQDEDSRRRFMCAFSKMIVKSQDKMRIYACTLVDDDPEYDLGDELQSSMQQQISMKHHRCYSCFAFGASCSET